ncbi:chloroperoxidase-like protein [Diaporthe eres]|nr:chloroperoxidase-like protein [Diaporthe eres]
MPGTNGLANQGYIPRNGRNIDPAQLAEAMLEVMNLQIAPFETEINTTLAHSTTGNSSTFNLEDSNVHNDIEIDGSLSRKDLYFGDNIHFDHDIWAQSSSKFEGDIITIRTAAESRRYGTQMAEAAGNPTYTPIPFIAGLAPAIYMLVFGGVNATQTQRVWIESFFRDRLPTHLGWTKSPVELTQEHLFALSSTIAAVPAATAKP